MSPRKSRVDRRRISYRIHVARSEQAGYTDIIKEHEELKQEIFEVLSLKRDEDNQKINALVTNNWQAALSVKFNKISDPIIEYFRCRPFASIVFLVVPCLSTGELQFFC